MGGSGVSGTVVFPDYIQRAHAFWINSDSGDPSSPEATVDEPTKTVVDVLNTALLSSGNPYDSYEYTAPDHSAMDAHMTSLDTRAALMTNTRLGTITTEALNRLGVSGVQRTIDISGAGDDAETRADSVFSLADLFTSETEIADFIAAVKTKADESGVLVDVDLSSLFSDTRTSVDSMMDALITKSDQTHDHLTLWDAAFDQVSTKLQDGTVVLSASVQQAVASAFNNADDAISNLVSAAIDAFDEDTLDKLTAAFALRQEYSKNQLLRRQGTQAALGNSTQTSTFQIAKALIEIQSAIQVDQFSGEVMLETFRTAAGAYANVTEFVVNATLQDTIQRNQTTVGLIESSVNSMVAMLGTRREIQRTLIGAYESAYRTEVGARTESERQNKESRDRFITQMAGLTVELMKANTQYRQTLAQLHGDVFNQYLQRATASEASDYARHNETLRAMLQYQIQYDQLGLTYDEALARNALEKSRTEYVTTREYEQDELEAEVNYLGWDFTVFERAANILAGPAGMAASVPRGPGKVASAAGGALGGGAQGAAVGSTFGPYGAAIGAGVGATIGLISGL